MSQRTVYNQCINKGIDNIKSKLAHRQTEFLAKKYGNHSQEVEDFFNMDSDLFLYGSKDGIHGRINRRANQVNNAKAYGLNEPKEGVFLWSFDVNGIPRGEKLNLYSFKKRNEKVFYN